MAEKEKKANARGLPITMPIRRSQRRRHEQLEWEWEKRAINGVRQVRAEGGGGFVALPRVPSLPSFSRPSPCPSWEGTARSGTAHRPWLPVANKGLVHTQETAANTLPGTASSPTGISMESSPESVEPWHMRIATVDYAERGVFFWLTGVSSSESNSAVRNGRRCHRSSSCRDVVAVSSH